MKILKNNLRFVFPCSLKELREKIVCSEMLNDKICFPMLWRLHIKRIALKNFLQCSVKRRMLFERVLRVSSFALAKWKEILAIIFKVHASFRSFLEFILSGVEGLRKEHIKTFLKFILSASSRACHTKRVIPSGVEGRSARDEGRRGLG